MPTTVVVATGAASPTVKVNGTAVPYVLFTGAGVHVGVKEVGMDFFGDAVIVAAMLL
jgi:thioredoxin reductase